VQFGDLVNAGQVGGDGQQMSAIHRDVSRLSQWWKTLDGPGGIDRRNEQCAEACVAVGSVGRLDDGPQLSSDEVTGGASLDRPR
jgi:hypothetical protein